MLGGIGFIAKTVVGMKIEGLKCWHCGTSLDAVPQPIGRREECPSCTSSLHVCRMCEFYAPGTGKNCREPMADDIREKEGTNFCDFFRPQPDLTGQSDADAAASRAKLEALFGGKGGAARPTGSDTGTPSQAPSPEAEDARKKLASVFGDSDREP